MITLHSTSSPVRQSSSRWIGVRTALTLFLALGIFAMAGSAIAEDTDDSSKEETELVRYQEEVLVEAEKGVSLMEPIPEAYPGDHHGDGMNLGPFGQLSERQVPFSLTSYTDTAVEARQPVEIVELLQDDPSVQREAARNSYFSGVSYRGLTTSFIHDGQPGVYYRGLVPSFEQFTRVEMLKGPSAFVSSGTGFDIGGMTNLVPKRGTAETVTNVTMTNLSGSAYKVHADVGGRFGEKNAFGIRANAVIEDGETSIEHMELDRKLKYLSIGDQLEITRRLSFVAGAQWTELSQTSWQSGTDTILSSPESDAWTPIAGATFHVNDQWTMYGSLSQGLEAGRQAPASAKNAGEATDPAITEQFELGLKS